MKKSIVIAIVGVLVVAGVGSAVYFQATKEPKVGNAVASTEQEVAVPSADDMEAQGKEVVAAKEAELEAQKRKLQEWQLNRQQKKKQKRLPRRKNRLQIVILAREIQLQNPINPVALERRTTVLLPVMEAAVHPHPATKRILMDLPRMTFQTFYNLGIV